MVPTRAAHWQNLHKLSCGRGVGEYLLVWKELPWPSVPCSCLSLEGKFDFEAEIWANIHLGNGCLCLQASAFLGFSFLDSCCGRCEYCGGYGKLSWFELSFCQLITVNTLFFLWLLFTCTLNALIQPGIMQIAKNQCSHYLGGFAGSSWWFADKEFNTRISFLICAVK